MIAWERPNEKLRKTVLPTGLTVLTKERLDSETIGMAIAVRAGSRDEDDITSGGSHWLEHAHFLGTDRRPNNQAVFGAIEAVGGDLNATTSWELTDYFIGVPADEFPLALDVLADMLLSSRFPEDAFERERKVVFEELNRRANTPGTLASDRFYTSVFQDHPARRLIGGTIDSVREIPLPTILAYRQERYVTGNMTVAVAGRIPHEAAVEAVARAFETLPVGGRIDRLVHSTAPAVASEERIALGERQAHVMIGGFAPALASDDRDAYFVLDSILDRTGRRLATEIRDKRGLATSVGTDYYGLTDVAAWAASGVTRPEHVDEVLDLMRSELSRIRTERVSAQEISDAVRSIRGGRQIGEERNLGQARRIAREEALDLLEPVDEWLARLDLVTPEDVQRVAQENLDLDRTTVVVVSF